MKFAVTGGAGFIGNNIARYLTKHNNDVVIIDNLHAGKTKNLSDIFNEIEFYKLDVRRKTDISKVLRDVDGIFHEAALVSVPESFQKPKEYFDVNVCGTKNVFEIAKKYGIKVVFASSSSVYGNVSKIPIKENFSRNPINPYGNTKLECEKLAKKFTDNDAKIIGLRYFNVYGKGQTGSYAGVITKFINRLTKNSSPIIFGDGKQKRDFIFVQDVAEANFYAMKSKVTKGFFNIGTGRAVTIKELAELMIGLSDNPKLKPIFSESLEGDIRLSQADTSLTKRSFGWNAKTSLRKGLAKTMSEF
jgi:UDP-glucose 4-epimerase